MAEVTRERQGQLVRRALELLSCHEEGVAAREVIATVQAAANPTPYELSTYPTNPNVRRFEKILRFSTIAAVKAGWLVKTKGRWFITTAGKHALTQYPDPEKLMQQATKLYREWRREQPDTEADDELATETPGAATTLEDAEESAWGEIEAHLSRMQPYDFQNLVAGLLRGMQYHVSWVAPVGPDKGFDIIAHKDPLGVERGRIKVQVKRRADKIAVEEIRAFMAVLGDDDVGIFVTTTGYTSEASSIVRQQERRRMMLLDAKQLFELWVEHYEQIPEEQRALLPLRAVHFLAPSD